MEIVLQAFELWNHTVQLQQSLYTAIHVIIDKIIHKSTILEEFSSSLKNLQSKNTTSSSEIL